MICFAWSGFPQYGARCIGAYVKAHPEADVLVVATRPHVPVEGMEKLARCPVVWIDGQCDIGVALGAKEMDAISELFVDGWFVPAFNQLRRVVKARGGRVFCMLDNNLQLYGWKLLAELAKAIRFRWRIRKLFDGYFLPGRAGLRLLKFYGAGRAKIATGYYSADSSLFHDGLPLAARAKKIVYVGQLNGRKNVLTVARAFDRSKIAERGWTLDMYGSGPLKRDLLELSARLPGFQVHDFVQPEELAALYRSATGFVLASQEEHWGVVVHEAALSGCFLLLSNRVGAAEDLVGRDNGIVFAPNEQALSSAFVRLSERTLDELVAAHGESLRLGNEICLDTFISGVEELLA